MKVSKGTLEGKDGGRFWSKIKVQTSSWSLRVTRKGTTELSIKILLSRKVFLHY